MLCWTRKAGILETIIYTFCKWFSDEQNILVMDIETTLIVNAESKLGRWQFCEESLTALSQERPFGSRTATGNYCDLLIKKSLCNRSTKAFHRLGNGRRKFHAEHFWQKCLFGRSFVTAVKLPIAKNFCLCTVLCSKKTWKKCVAFLLKIIFSFL